MRPWLVLAGLGAWAVVAAVRNNLDLSFFLRGWDALEAPPEGEAGQAPFGIARMNVRRAVVGSEARAQPDLVFIKTMKTGGTTVQFALMRAAVRYRIPFFYPNATFKRAWGNSSSKDAENLGWRNYFELQPADETWVVQQPGGRIWWSHGMKNAWMDAVFSSRARYVTVMRDPVQQTISYVAFELALKLEDYVAVAQGANFSCPRMPRIPLALESLDEAAKMFKPGAVLECYSAEHTKNATTVVLGALLDDQAGTVAKHPNLVARFGPNDLEFATKGSVAWIVDHARNYTAYMAYYFNRGMYEYPSGEELIQVLRREYFLVGTTNRLDEFIVLLALAHGWDPAALYYLSCKRNALNVPLSELAAAFPQAVRRLELRLRGVSEAYDWVVKAFDAYVQSLGPWFPPVVERFRKGLKAYQEEQAQRRQAHLEGANEIQFGSKNNPFDFESVQVIDGISLTC